MQKPIRPTILSVPKSPNVRMKVARLLTAAMDDQKCTGMLNPVHPVTESRKRVTMITRWMWILPSGFVLDRDKPATFNTDETDDQWRSACVGKFRKNPAAEETPDERPIQEVRNQWLKLFQNSWGQIGGDDVLIGTDCEFEYGLTFRAISLSGASESTPRMAAITAYEWEVGYRIRADESQVWIPEYCGSLFELQGLPNPNRKMAEMCPAVKKLVDQRKELYCEYGTERSLEEDMDEEFSGARSCEDVLKLIVTTNKMVETVVDKFPLLKMWMLMPKDTLNMMDHDCRTLPNSVDHDFAMKMELAANNFATGCLEAVKGCHILSGTHGNYETPKKAGG